MGMHRHHGLMYTSWDPRRAKRRHRLACKLFRKAAKECGRSCVSELIGPTVNSTFTFAIVPSGSKVGWEPAELHDEAMDKFVNRLKQDRESWIEFTYGDETRPCGFAVVTCSEKRLR